MDLELIGTVLFALTVACTVTGLRLAFYRRRMARLASPPTPPTGDPKHVPLLIAPGFVVALVVFALGGPINLILPVFFGTLMASLYIYKRVRAR